MTDQFWKKCMECFRLLLDHLAWLEHQFLSGIRDSRKTGSLWGKMRGVGGVRKSIHRSWLAKGLGLGLLCWGFKGVQEEIPSEKPSTLLIGSVAFPPEQCTSPQLNPCQRLFDQDRHQDRQYVSWKEGGKGLASIEDTVDALIQQLEDYLEKHERGLITTIRNDTDNTIDERRTTTRKQKWEGKQLYGRFKRLINIISHQKTLTLLRKGNLKRETESLLIAAQGNAIRNNHIKARTDKTQRKSKCRLCRDRDKTINHIISECSKLAQKEYKARYDWVSAVIPWEMCRKFQVDHTNKWYMHNPASVLENDSHKLLWDFNIQTDHLIQARRPDLIIIIKKKNLKNCRLCCPGGLQNKSEGKWKEG